MQESSNHWPAFFIGAGEYWDCAVKPGNDIRK
jgi:hypothetical protein